MDKGSRSIRRCRYQFLGIIYYSGCWRSHPSPASIGFLILHKDDQRVIENFLSYVGSLDLISHGAHYKVLIAGLHHALECAVSHT